MKKIMVLALALVMVMSAVSVIGASAAETSDITYTDHLEKNNHVGATYDVSNALIAWVKQANGTLVWVPADDARSDADIIAQAKANDPSLKNENAVLRGIGSAETPNSNGDPVLITVSVNEGKTELCIEGKYSHFVAGYPAAEETEAPAVTEEPTEAAPEEDPTEALEPTGTIRIDAPLKMAVAFEDGNVYYGGEMKEVEFNREYPFQMCAVNWDNGLFDGNENGVRGTVVYRMKVLHQDDFLAVAREAKADPERYLVKGMDVIDNEAKMIIVNGDAEDAHLETDVNSFFAAYRFHFTNEDFDKKTGIRNVINTPVESLSVNLPIGSTIACDAYDGDVVLGSANVFITRNSGVGEYEDEYLTSVNDYTWEY